MRKTLLAFLLAPMIFAGCASIKPSYSFVSSEGFSISTCKDAKDYYKMISERLDAENKKYSKVLDETRNEIRQEGNSDFLSYKEAVMSAAISYNQIRLILLDRDKERICGER